MCILLKANNTIYTPIWKYILKHEWLLALKTVNTKVKFSGTRRSVKRITYTEFAQYLSASIDRVNEFAVVKNIVGSYSK
jgi:hypothetical protein